MSRVETIGRATPPALTIASIKSAVARRYRISELDLLSRQNRREIAEPRQLAMALARRLTNHSRYAIGLHFGGRHPTTVLHAQRTIVSRYIADSRIEQKLHDVLRDLADPDSIVTVANHPIRRDALPVGVFS